MFALSLPNGAELRLLQPHHAEEIFKVIERNRARLHQWLPWVDNIRCVGDEEKFICNSLGLFASNGAFQCGIFMGDVFVGAIGLHPINHANRKVELGYWLDSAHQGRGLMTNACRAIVDHAFGALGLNRVIIYCAVENRRSRAVAERLGFKLEGIARQSEWLYDHFVDWASYSMLASEWSGGRASDAD